MNGHLSDTDDRRRHRRLAFQLPVECRLGGHVVRTITRNVSTGGMYVELDAPDFRPGDEIEIDLSLPAAEGVSAYPGRGRCVAEILRTIELPAANNSIPRFGIGARFVDRMRFSYDHDR